MSSAIAAAMIKYVAASMRSGMISCKHPPRFETPSITIVLVPIPWILAPILFNNVAISIISGSLAAFSIVVLPLAYTAAIIILIVAPTLEISKKIFVPTNSSACKI